MSDKFVILLLLIPPIFPYIMAFILQDHLENRSEVLPALWVILLSSAIAIYMIVRL